jgi:hypothetical protein
MYAYLRALPVQRAVLPGSTLSWSIRYDLALGSDRPIAGYLSQVPPLRHAADPDSPIARGE